MKQFLFSLISGLFIAHANEGYLGSAGEDAFAIINESSHALALANSNSGVSDQYLNYTQSALMDSVELVEGNIRPGLSDEIYGSLYYRLAPQSDFQLHSLIEFWDRGQIDNRNETGDLNGYEQPIAVSLKQGLSYQVNPQLHLGSRVGVIIEHLSQISEAQTAAAAILDLGIQYRPTKSRFNYGLAINNLSYVMVEHSRMTERNSQLNTQIQAGLSFRPLFNPRFKWNFDYLVQAYDESAALIGLSYQTHPFLTLYTSTQLSHSKIFNLSQKIQSNEGRRNTGISPLLAGGFKFTYNEWQISSGLNYIPALTTIDFAFNISKFL